MNNTKIERKSIAMTDASQGQGEFNAKYFSEGNRKINRLKTRYMKILLTALFMLNCNAQQIVEGNTMDYSFPS
jgi:hypothetical protein